VTIRHHEAILGNGQFPAIWKRYGADVEIIADVEIGLKARPR
jgi:hypothetical protein